MLNLRGFTQNWSFLVAASILVILASHRIGFSRGYGIADDIRVAEIATLKKDIASERLRFSRAQYALQMAHDAEVQRIGDDHRSKVNAIRSRQLKASKEFDDAITEALNERGGQCVHVPIPVSLRELANTSANTVSRGAETNTGDTEGTIGATPAARHRRIETFGDLTLAFETLAPEYELLRAQCGVVFDIVSSYQGAQ